MVLESWLLHCNGSLFLFTTRVLLYKMLAEGYMHIQVKSDSYVNIDVLRRVWGNTVRYYTARDAQRCKRGKCYGSCKSRDSFPAGDKRIRENINNLENQRLQKSWTLKDSTGSNKGPGNTPIYRSHGAANSFHSALSLYQLSVIWTAWAYRLREGVQKSVCTWNPWRAWTWPAARWGGLEGNISCLGFQAQLCPAKLLLHCWGCRQELQGVWFAHFSAECFCSYPKPCWKFSIRSLSLKILLWNMETLYFRALLAFWRELL